jgi:chromosome segregation ATPase
MTNRVEPTLSGKVALDDAKPIPAQTPRPNPVSQRVVEVKSPLAPLALIAALIALGVIGFVYWQFSVERAQLEVRLQQADARIMELEQKLTVTGDESSQSLTVLGANVKAVGASLADVNSEIRKLWALSNDRNRKEIKDNALAIAELQTMNANNKKTFSDLQQSLEGNKTQVQALSGLSAKLKDLQGELAVLSEVQESQQAAFAQTRNLPSELQTLKSSFNSRISANEEAVKSMDAFRLQVNRQLLQIGGTTAR